MLACGHGSSRQASLAMGYIHVGPVRAMGGTTHFSIADTGCRQRFGEPVLCLQGRAIHKPLLGLTGGNNDGVRKGGVSDFFNFEGLLTQSDATLFDFKRPGELTEEEQGSRATSVARGIKRAFDRKSAERLDGSSAFMEALAMGEDPTGLGAPTTALGPDVKRVFGALDTVQQTDTATLLRRIQGTRGDESLSRETDRNMARLSKIVGKIIAEELVRRLGPPKINHRDMMDQINEGTEAAFDGAR